MSKSKYTKALLEKALARSNNGKDLTDHLGLNRSIARWRFKELMDLHGLDYSRLKEKEESDSPKLFRNVINMYVLMLKYLGKTLLNQLICYMVG